MSLCLEGFNARQPHMPKNHFLKPLSLGYFGEVWHQ
jgi:hypothetical protein